MFPFCSFSHFIRLFALWVFFFSSVFAISALAQNNVQGNDPIIFSNKTFRSFMMSLLLSCYLLLLAVEQSISKGFRLFSFRLLVNSALVANMV
jgi:hypothetical protein